MPKKLVRHLVECDIYFEEGVDDLIQHLTKLKNTYPDYMNFQINADRDMDNECYILYGDKFESDEEYRARVELETKDYTKLIDRKQQELNQLETNIEELKKLMENL